MKSGNELEKSKSDRKQPVTTLDLVNLTSLKEKIEAQKVAKSVKRSITTPVVRVEPTSVAKSTSTPFVRKVASSGAPEHYLGFSTNQTPVTRKTKVRKEKAAEEPAPTRKTATITTSSWRKNTQNAKKLLKKKKSESKSKQPEQPAEPENETKVDEEKQTAVDNILSGKKFRIRPVITLKLQTM